MIADLNPEIQQIILIVVLVLLLVGLFIKSLRPSFVFGGALMILMFFNIVSIELFLQSLGNQSVITIFLLIFITTALKDNFNLLDIVDRLFKNIKNPRLFIFSITSIVALLSSLVNNTPVVALMIPYVQDWSRRNSIASSKILIPLTYSATLGGMITLIGTSTNLVLNGLMTSNGFEGFSFLEFSILGLIVTGVGVVYFTTIGYHLLPNRLDALIELKTHIRDYVAECSLTDESGIIDKTISEAGLRHLEGIFLTEIVRQDYLISPVSPNEKIRKGDLLYFAGETSKVMNLVDDPKMGLQLHTAEKFRFESDAQIVEVLVPATSSLAGKKVRDSNFREEYDAAIVAIHRNGKKLGGKIGDVILQYGDLLLLTIGKDFTRRNEQSKNLFIMSTHKKNKRANKKTKQIVGVSLIALIVLIVTQVLSLFIGLLIMLSILMATRMFGVNELKKQFNIELLVILISAISLGTAIYHSGASEILNENLFGFLIGKEPIVIMGVVFGITLLLTSFITNIAAVSIVFPLTVALVTTMNLPPKPFFLAMAFAASAAFLTPVSYQTNLMVYGPGGYLSKDFFKSGLPLTIIYSFICMAFLNQMLT